MREETDVCGISKKVLFHTYFPPVYICNIAQRGKSVKANAHRHKNMQYACLPLFQALYAAKKKPAVLCVYQPATDKAKANDQQYFSL